MAFTEPCFGIGHNLSLICQMTSEDIKHQLIIKTFGATDHFVGGWVWVADHEDIIHSQGRKYYTLHRPTVLLLMYCYVWNTFCLDQNTCHKKQVFRLSRRHDPAVRFSRFTEQEYKKELFFYLHTCHLCIILDIHSHSFAYLSPLYYT